MTREQAQEQIVRCEHNLKMIMDEEDKVRRSGSHDSQKKSNDLMQQASNVQKEISSLRQIY